MQTRNEICCSLYYNFHCHIGTIAVTRLSIFLTRQVYSFMLRVVKIDRCCLLVSNFFMLLKGHSCLARLYSQICENRNAKKCNASLQFNKCTR